MAERRIVTVLFADVVGFTALSESLDPEDVATVQQAYFAAVRETLDRYGGVLEKFIGDAAVAAFGVPRGQEDDAERAVRGALALHSAVSGLSAQLGLEPGTLVIRVGVNTGEVAYDPVERQVTGDAVNVAARLQAAAPTGGVLVGPDTALAVAAAFELEPVGRLDLKGKAEGVAASLVAGTRERPNRAAALGRLRSHTVGREDQLRALHADLDQAVAGGPRWTLLVAPPGVGKSRLANEFVHALRTRDRHVRLWTVRSVSEAAHPYQPVADLLVEALRSSGLDPALRGGALAEAARPLLRERLGSAGVPSPASIADQAASLLAAEDPAVAGADRETRFGAWLTTLGVLEDGVPTVWLVEDVHAASGDARAFLASATGTEADGSRLVVMTARPALLAQDTVWQRRASDAGGRLVHLEALDARQAADLVQQLVGSRLPGELVEHVARASDGNPLFIEELLRTWLSVGVLREGPDGFELTRPPEQLRVPTTVQAMYAAQLDDLPADARRTAQRAAVMGRTFLSPVLDHLDGGGTAEGLEALTRRALVDGPHGRPLGDGYTFRHGLLRDTSYLTLSRTERAHLHVGVAEWIELAGGDGDEHADEVAHHLGEALLVAPALLTEIGGRGREQVRERAVSWRRRAAWASLRSSAHEATRGHAERLAELLDAGSGGGDDESLVRAEAAELLGAAVSVTDLDRGSGLLAEALERYAACLERAVDEGARATAARGHVRATVRLGRLRYDQVRFDTVVELAERSLALVAGIVPEDELAVLRVARLRGAGAMGDATTWPALTEEGHALIAAAERIGDEDLLFDAWETFLEYGELEPDRYRAVFADQVARAERLGRWRDLVVLRRVEAVQRAQHDAASALAAAREVPQLARSFGLVEAQAFATYGVVEAALAAGAWDEALEAGVQALDLAEKHAVTRAYVRTSFALVPVAVARGEDGLVDRMVRAHEAQRPGHPELSSYARTVLTGVRLWAGRRPVPGDEPTVDDLADFFPAGASAASQAEVNLHQWLRDGRADDVAAVVERVTGRAPPDDEPTLAASSWHLVRAWWLLATGDLPRSAQAARSSASAARTCGAPWWEARALRALAAAGAGDGDDIERRVRLELALGVVTPQPPPVVAGPGVGPDAPP